MDAAQPAGSEVKVSVIIAKWFDTERITHSIKTAIACMIGFLLANIVGFPTASQWIVVSIIVVMCAQIYVGGMMQKAYLRFLGTIVGCLFAIIALTSAGDTDLVIMITLALSSFIFSYLATGQESMSYAGTLGAATTAIIMLGNPPTLLTAGARFMEISIGILIAALVSQFVLPIHARTHLRRTQAATLSQLRDFYKNLMTSFTSSSEAMQYEELDDSIVKSISRQRLLAKEALRERVGALFDPKHFVHSLYCEREMLRAIDFMHHALVNIKDARDLFTQSAALHTLNDTIIQSLDTIIQTIEAGTATPGHIHIPSIDPLREDIQKSVSTPTREQQIYINGFLFSAEVLLHSLSKLATLYQVPVFTVSEASETVKKET